MNSKTLFIPAKRRISSKASIVLLLLVIIFLGTFLRLYKLGYNDVWFDEAISALSADNVKGVYSLSDEKIPYGNPAFEMRQTQLIYYKTLDPQPFFYYFLLKRALNYLGNSEFALRLLSVIFSVLSILAVYKLGAKLSGKKYGVYAAFLMSISPMQLWYAQEARQYSLATFLIVLSSYFLLLALEEKGNKYWIGFVVSTIVLIYTNYIGFIVLLSSWSLLGIKKYRVSVKKWIIASIIIALFFLPWMHIFWQHLLFVKEVFWVAKPTLISVMATFKNFNIGYSNFGFLLVPSLILFFVLMSLGIFNLDKKARVFLLTFLFLPILLIFIISQWIPIYLDRQLILFSPFYYLVIAKGISSIRSNLVRAAVICLILVFIVPSICNYYSNQMPMQPSMYHQGAYVKKPFQPAIKYIEDNWQEGDTLAYGHISVQPSFIYYQQKNGNLRQNDKNKGSYKRIWLISSSWPRNRVLSPDVELLRERLGERHNKVDAVEFDGIFIDLYAMRHNS